MSTVPLEWQKAILVIWRVSASLSFVGSAWICGHVLCSKEKRNRVYHRLLLGMSLVEWVDSIIPNFLLQWAVPKGYGFQGPFTAALGTQTTCNVQGFFVQFSLSSTLYNASLAIYCLLTVRYNYSERIMAKQVEPWMHAIPLVAGLTTAIASVPLTLFNSFGHQCYIYAWPPGCKQSYSRPKNDEGEESATTTCVRGDNALLYSIFFFELWQLLAYVVTTVCMVMVYWKLRHQEIRNERYQFERQTQPQRPQQSPQRLHGNQQRAIAAAPSSSPPSSSNRQNSRRFAIQSLLYVLAFYVSHAFSMTGVLYFHVTNEYRLGIAVLTSIFLPLEGFLNFLVYIRPRYIRMRDLFKDESFLFVLKQVLWEDPSLTQNRGRAGRSGHSRHCGNRVVGGHATATAKSHPTTSVTMRPAWLSLFSTKSHQLHQQQKLDSQTDRLSTQTDRLTTVVELVPPLEANGAATCSNTKDQNSSHDQQTQSLQSQEGPPPAAVGVPDSSLAPGEIPPPPPPPPHGHHYDDTNDDHDYHLVENLDEY